MTLSERFETKVDRSGDCHLWTAYRTHKGYGAIQVDHKPARAHRVAWELAHGPIPSGVVVMHTCDNPPCVNLAHLRLGTVAENNADMTSKGRRRAGGVKVTDAQVRQIRAWVSYGFTRAEVGRWFGIGKAQASHIVSGLARGGVQ